MIALDILASLPCINSLKLADMILRELHGRGLIIAPSSWAVTKPATAAITLSSRADFAIERATHQLDWPDDP